MAASTNKESASAGAEATPGTANPSNYDFDDISVPELDAWYDIETQKGFVGKIAGYKSFKDTLNEGKTRHVLMVQLLEPCKAMKKGGEAVALKAGSILGVTLRSNLMPLLEYLDSKPVVKVLALDKVSIGGGRSLWRFKVNVQKGAKKSKSPVEVIDDED